MLALRMHHERLVGQEGVDAKKHEGVHREEDEECLPRGVLHVVPRKAYSMPTMPRPPIIASLHTGRLAPRDERRGSGLGLFMPLPPERSK